VRPRAINIQLAGISAAFALLLSCALNTTGTWVSRTGGGNDGVGAAGAGGGTTTTTTTSGSGNAGGGGNAGGAAGSGAVAGGGTAGGGGQGGAAGFGGQGGGICQSDPMPTGQCPNAACDICFNGKCTIACGTPDACKDVVTTCPPGFECEVLCSGVASCSGTAVITCPPGHKCSVLCSGPDACKGGTSIVCPVVDGTCHVTCSGPVACNAMAMACGTKACELTCSNGENPAFACAACMCGDKCP